MKTKTKKISLLAISTIALAMPFAASVAATNSSTVYLNATDAGTTSVFNGGAGVNANDQSTSFGPLSDQGGISSVFRGLTGTGISNTYFSVAANTALFSATENLIPKSFAITAVTATLIDLTHPSTIVLGRDATTGAFTYDALKAGDKYDFQATYNLRGTAALYSTITVAAPIPEPEQWAMMMVGLFLVAAKVTKTKKSATLLMPFNA
jgi:hypothetical protein